MAMHIEPGTLIHGTLRAQDLIPAFFKELERVNLDKAVEIAGQYNIPSAPNVGYRIANDDPPSVDFLLDDLFDALDTEAHNFGLYFGAHEGDGSDFGYWPIDEQA